MSDLDTLEAFVNIPIFSPTYDEDEKVRKIKHFSKIAAKHGDVIVGEVVDVWEDYVENKVHATITYPVQNEEFSGTKKVECFIGVDSTIGVAQMSFSIGTGRTLVVDRETKQIIASYTYFI